MRLNGALIDYLRAHGAAAVSELLEIGTELDMAVGHDHPPAAPTAVPLLLDADEHTLLLHTTAVLAAALADLPGLLFGSLEAALQDLHVPSGIASFLREDIPLSVQLARSDFLHGEDGWHIGEINITGGVGGLTVGDYDDVVRRHPLLADFLAEHCLTSISPLPVLARAVRRRCAGLAIDGRPLVAIIDWQGYGADQETEQRKIADGYRQHGFDAVLCHHREVQYRDGRLWHENRPVHVVQRAFLLEDLPADPMSAAPVLEAAAAGAVVLVSPFRDEWLASKTSFVMLHEARARGLLDPQVAGIVARMVPATWLLEDGSAGRGRFSVTPGELRTRRAEDLVLKPGIGSGGAGVLLGASTPPDVFWTSVQQAAREGSYVVQDFVVPGPVPFPWVTDGELVISPVQPITGIFQVDGKYAGMVARMLRGTEPGMVGVMGGAFWGGAWTSA
jgi:hypothetical protein